MVIAAFAALLGCWMEMVWEWSFLIFTINLLLLHEILVHLKMI